MHRWLQNRRAFLALLVAFLVIPLFTREGVASIAPAQGSVLVRTYFDTGGIAAYQDIQVEKLQGEYPVPPGPYVTNGWGRVWISLYPGVYRFTVAGAETQPTVWEVSVSSGGEYYPWFLLTSQES